jgi:hypothetical protein
VFGNAVIKSDRATSAGKQALDFAFGPFPGPEARVTDRDIRIALAGGWGPSLLREGGAAMEEVRCWRGYVRADYLVVSPDALSIIEIKSDADTLRRFGEQLRVYSAFADRAALVVGWTLAAAALRSVPWWCEVWLAEKPPASETRLILLREGARNPDVNTYGLASMLPVDEARKIAVDAGLPIQDSRGKEFRQVLAEHLTVADLRTAVMEWLNRLSVQRTSQPS